MLGGVILELGTRRPRLNPHLLVNKRSLLHISLKNRMFPDIIKLISGSYSKFHILKLFALIKIAERKKFDKDIISFLLSYGADINDINDFEETPLVTFIKRGPRYVTIEHISFLLENGADPNVCADGNNSALLEAISFPSFKVAAFLIDAKANINHIGKDGNTVLHAMFSKDCDTNVQRYSPYSYDSDDDTSDEDITASLNSSSNSCDDEIDVFTEKNSIPQINYGSIETMDDPQIEGIDNTTNLGITDIDNTKTEEKLRRTSYQTKENNYSTSTAIAANWTQKRKKKCKGSSRETVDILLNAAASVTLNDDNGKTPLFLLINSVEQCYGYVIDEQVAEMVSELIGKGADPNSTPFGEDSALILAVEYLLPNVVQILLESGANTDHIGKNGQNALHSCFRCKENRPQVCLEILDLLSDHLNLDKNVDVFFRKFWKYINTNNVSRNRDVLDSVTYKILSTEEEVQVNLASDLEDSPLIYFCSLGCSQAVKMLLFHKADVNHVGKRGTALHQLIDLTDDENAVSLFDCLLKENPRMNISDNMGKSIAEKAIDILCGKRSETSSLDYQYYSSMNEYKFKNVSSCVQKLLEAGVSPDPNDLNDALLMCAKKSDFKGMECLIRHGGDFCKKDTNGSSVLHLCWLDCKYITFFFNHIII
ncbi:unnamed protein product [Mytilus coruscus]|uniref:Uncharacterized protein n=1 Tax=Mytilus coruscus TaxID=42192 RepID=A0A6J8D3Y0_MYTCO|nr:unnamed protein product [Mytilus coruscus]